MEPLTYGTVTGSFRGSAYYADNRSGTVSFVAVATGPRPDDAPALPATVTVPLVDNAITAELVATDNPSLHPSTWTYHITMDFYVPANPWGGSGYRFLSTGRFSINAPAGWATDLTSMKSTGKKPPMPRQKGEVRWAARPH